MDCKKERKKTTTNQLKKTSAKEKKDPVVERGREGKTGKNEKKTLWR